ncbi:cbb3-type cytochrome c oxidase subunit 3 [Sphingomicrobium sediminis]|uniref:Cbb3-type cytochrome c oxidase subunit 3 n=1 Tax=Sphingomicrobium sediminis TaxID=2950949 RepID=A0A9X2J3N4_9SPHN|nr:cbb3-type cytochrome c oxidase subunit 3 [Sphingomicrobium sediminis]MCM8558220.1 cbb3-type cytochrome c oxidase subunit 3 [Sphingomicrobium sediminis]
MYETLRQIADSWGLLAMLVLFLFFVVWAFRPGSKDKANDAKTSIFDKDHDDGRA